MSPSDLVAALEANGVSVATVHIDGRPALLAKRQIGDLLIERLILDLPVRVPGSMRVALARDFDVPLAALAIAAHDL